MGFGLSLLLGAFWLFFIQPLAGKAVVPWYGGGANVWITCMVFFQAMLLAGYLYAHLLVSRVRPASQVWVHGLVLGLAMLAGLWTAALAGAPFMPPAFLKPLGTESPVLRILITLAATVGLPFIAVAATSPLVQAWYVRIHPGRPVYRLYALSNAGSFLGLLLFPFGAEFFLSRQAQGWLVFGILAVTAVCMVWIGTRASAQVPLEAQPPDSDHRPWTGTWKPLAYVGLSALGSAILVGGTNFLSAQVATIPLLWVLPLGAYLLSFIICFEWGLDLTGRWGAALLAGFLAAQGLIPLLWNRGFVLVAVVLVILVVLLGGMLAHGKLYALRPEPRRLTSFYLLVALGGVLGGVASGLLAPLVFKKVIEFHLALLLLCLVGWWIAAAATGAWIRVIRGLSVLSAGVVAFQFFATALDSQKAYRDFYGPMKVKSLAQDIKKLTHGGTTHGLQVMGHPEIALAYYGAGSGIARAMEAQRSRIGLLRIGIIGLGVGSAVGYARAGDTVAVYEISPLVIALAGKSQPKEFTILRDSPAQVEVHAGDGRLSLDREFERGGSRHFDLLMVDAFSGGNVPWHLLTVEAMAGFRRHLAPGGIIAVHASNERRVDLLVLAAGGKAGLWAAPVHQPQRTRLAGTTDEILTPSTYVLLAADQATLMHPAILEGADLLLAPRGPRSQSASQTDPSPKYPLRLLRGTRPWTDDRNCLSELLWLGR